MPDSVSPELARALAGLSVTRLRVGAFVDDRVVLPPVPGRAIHGMLGQPLACALCSCHLRDRVGSLCHAPQPEDPARPDIEAHAPECRFRHRYEPVAPPDLALALGFGGGRGNARDGVKAPPALIVVPPLRRTFYPGDRLAFGLTLIGPPVGADDPQLTVGETTRWIAAVRQALGKGFGRADGQGRTVTAYLVEVHDGTGRLVWDGRQVVGQPQAEAVWTPPDHPEWLALRSLTPLLVTVDGEPLHRHPRDRQLAEFLRASARRGRALAALYGADRSPAPVLDRLLEPCRTGRAPEPPLHPVPIHIGGRRPRTGTSGTVGGGVWTPEAVALARLAEVVGVGRLTSHGLGQVERL